MSLRTYERRVEAAMNQLMADVGAAFDSFNKETFAARSELVGDDVAMVNTEQRKPMLPHEDEYMRR